MGRGAKKLEQCSSKTDEYLIRWGLIFKREKIPSAILHASSNKHPLDEK